MGTTRKRNEKNYKKSWEKNIEKIKHYLENEELYILTYFSVYLPGLKLTDKRFQLWKPEFREIVITKVWNNNIVK